MNEVFEGIRVLDVAQNTFGPAAAMILADFGADVIKVEHPVRGDPQRGLVTAAIQPTVDGIHLALLQTNRGKKSMGLDLSVADGRDILYELVRGADVFLTNFLPKTTRKLGIDEPTIRGIKPDMIYARATGQGPDGPEADKPGYDSTVYWGRGGIAATFARGGRPPAPAAAFGDRAGAMNLAFGIAAALLRRERTGEGAIVDVSLLGTAIWQNSSTTVYSLALGEDFGTRSHHVPNPLSHIYATSDDRWLILGLLQSDRFWSEFCQAVGRPDLRDDPRYTDAKAREENSEALVSELDQTFRSAPLREWRTRLSAITGAWAPIATVFEAADDPQAAANNYVLETDQGDGRTVRLVPPPVRFDGKPPTLRRTAEFAEHGEEILLELGKSRDDIRELKRTGVIT
jgi:crotonobetainyl-CoA:carnitine CoA-transferase CaiB-like acyl-CoA transferase